MVETVKEKMDIATEVANPQSFPWEYDDESVKEITCAGVLEYVPGKLRGQFMDEVYRILIPGGTITVSVMYWNSAMAYHDYEFEWPPLAEQSFLMFNKAWREANKKKELDCNFEFTYGFNYDPETAAKSSEVQAFWMKHYSNAAPTMQLVLTKEIPK